MTDLKRNIQEKIEFYLNRFPVVFLLDARQVGKSIDVSEMRVRDYLDIANKTYLWRGIPSYEKNISQSIAKVPKSVFRDTGVSCYLNKIFSREEMIESHQFGYIFEVFVIEEIIKGLEALVLPNWDYYYFRTRGGAEIDLIREGPFKIKGLLIKNKNSRN